MGNPAVPDTDTTPAPSCIVLGREHLLDVTEICKITGLGKATAAKLMKETGCCFKLHRRLYVIESSFFSYLHEVEVNQPCTL